MQNSKLIAFVSIAAMLAACTEPGGEPGRGVMNGGAPDKQDAGTAIGAVGGALIGSTIGGGAGRVVAVVGGALLGGVLGNVIGKSLDNADRAAYDRASQQALESGKTQSWKNPDSNNHGTIIPKPSYTTSEGQVCRKYTQIIYVDGEKHRGYGTACRQPDGTWHIQ